MEDCCAVCAETLGWVAYGSCGHQEVCSTCVVRLRFIIGDRHCCICKTDCSTVFVTKALGSFTEIKSDFIEFPHGVSEGQHGQFWYHEDSQAYFDDVDNYKMIKALCKLSCSICDSNSAELRRNGNNRRNTFRNIEQLKGHLYHQHKMFMCSLCLEGRKIFISEQKLYNKSQLRRHISSGNSEVDGSEIERCGFVGHPICEFCKNPFYGDTELYAHMSTEHYTCHICQRQHPGQYDYYRNYDDLEVHFRQEHFLCEYEACLVKKFVIFQTEAEMKRHNTIEHGGNMSRSKRNAALQIPVSFRYRQSAEQDQRRGRGRSFHREPNQLTSQARIEMAVAEGRSHESSFDYFISNTERGEINQPVTLTSSIESLAINSHPEDLSSRSDAMNNLIYGSFVEEMPFPLSNYELPELTSRYAQALNQGSFARLGETSFPPLPGAKDNIKSKITPLSDGLAANTLAARRNLHNKEPVSPKPSQIYEPSFSNSVSLEMWPPAQSAAASGSISLLSVTANQVGPAFSSTTWAPSMKGNASTASIPNSSLWNSNKMNKARHSASAPNLSINGHSNNPPGMINELPTTVESLQHMENLQTANKSLIQRILSGLGMDEQKYAAFRTISTEYRQGKINTSEYLSYVEQFKLLHLLPDLARIYPDSVKRKELIDAFNINYSNKGLQENNRANAACTNKDGKKEKGKVKAAKDVLADNILDQVRKLQTNHHTYNDEPDDLSKDGYRTSKDQVSVPGSMIVDVSSSEKEAIAGKNSGREVVRKTRRQFHKIPFADGSTPVFPDLRNEDLNS